MTAARRRLSPPSVTDSAGRRWTVSRWFSRPTSRRGMRQDLPGEGKRHVGRPLRPRFRRSVSSRPDPAFQTWIEITGVAALACRRYPAQAARIASITAEITRPFSRLKLRFRVYPFCIVMSSNGAVNGNPGSGRRPTRRPADRRR